MNANSFQYHDFDLTRYALLTKLVFAVFMILVPILLLNMLIAMMGNTYQSVIAKSEKEWRKQVGSNRSKGRRGGGLERSLFSHVRGGWE